MSFIGRLCGEQAAVTDAIVRVKEGVLPGHRTQPANVSVVMSKPRALHVPALVSALLRR